ncbi:MAG: ATP-binding protein [Candidatus Electrothrix sp.]
MRNPENQFTIKAKLFRAFREEVSFEIKPLTLLYGFNQAGKSSLLRLLPFLADSNQLGAGPLDLSSPAFGGATLKELGCLCRPPSLTPWFSFEASGFPEKPSLKMQFDNDQGLVVNRLRITSDSREIFSADYSGTSSRIGSKLVADYEGRCNGTDWSGELIFSSLFPQGLPEQAEAIVEKVQSAITPLERLQWLQADRLSGKKNDRASRCCRPDGSDLPALLDNPEGQNLLKKASTWLASQEGLGNAIRLQQDSSGHQEFVHGAHAREALPLSHAGEGIQSLLPIVVCSYWAETKNAAAPTMLAVEEPEAHLHPTVQVALLNRLIETVQAGIPVVLETHSVYLLRAMQVALLEKRLVPEEVALYWVEQTKDSVSKASRIAISPDATLTGWPPEVFEKEQELAHRIFDLRWTKGGR